MSVRVKKEIASNLAKQLHEITNEASVDTLGIFTHTGARVAFFTKSTADAHEFSAIAASLQNAGNLAVGKLNFGEPTDIMVRTKNGFIILRKLGIFILTAGARNIDAFSKAAQVLLKHSPILKETLDEIPEGQY
jgi:predicted regulator of Ras-like GTPase activity (Roadblock/LC7/MglB family)